MAQAAPAVRPYQDPGAGFDRTPATFTHRSGTGAQQCVPYLQFRPCGLACDKYAVACQYSLAGNRTSDTLNAATTQQYAYDAASQVVGWSYDGAGNLTGDGTTNYGYDDTCARVPDRLTGTTPPGRRAPTPTTTAASSSARWLTAPRPARPRT